ncbi:MAG: glycosyltransferase family 2 protein [Bacteroidetes bacterium]|nr:glycosyltransferase family 2 protein [Bacteroidota bacterium]
MTVQGFTFVRNALRYDYPVVESIRSLLPLCDTVTVCLGQSEDGTEALIRDLQAQHPGKLCIVPSVWDDSLREGGRVLAIETDKAYDAMPPGADWCIYLQADEVLHEAGYAPLRQAMAQWKDDPRVEGLALPYRHFWGSYDYVGSSRKWYRREVRVVRQHPRLRSYRDAQGFRLAGRPLHVKLAMAYVHHYGWVRDPQALQQKVRDFHRLWHDDEWVARHVPDVPEFDYTGIDALERYPGTHPAVMQERIARKNWDFQPPGKFHQSLKDKLLYYIERHTGRRLFEYRNYKLL